MELNELLEMLLSNNPREELLLNEERLFELIPELKACKGFKQNSDWHIYDVYEHILHVIDYVPKDIVLRLAALFHDVGKPLSYTEDALGIGHFYGHWVESQKIFDSFSKKYNIDKDLSTEVSNLIYYHDINVSKLSEDDRKEMYSLLGFNGIDMLYEFKRADLLAQNEKYLYILDDYDRQKVLMLKYNNE